MLNVLTGPNASVALRVVLEMERQLPWLSRLLAEFGHEVIVANVRQVALITYIPQPHPHAP